MKFIFAASDSSSPTKTNKSTCYTCGSWFKKRARRMCRKKLLYKRIPIVEWLPKYRKEYIVSDMVAGLTVGLTVIPQAIAYANVAALPLQVSKYCIYTHTQSHIGRRTM